MKQAKEPSKVKSIISAILVIGLILFFVINSVWHYIIMTQSLSALTPENIERIEVWDNALDYRIFSITDSVALHSFLGGVQQPHFFLPNHPKNEHQRRLKIYSTDSDKPLEFVFMLNHNRPGTVCVQVIGRTGSGTWHYGDFWVKELYPWYQKYVIEHKNEE